MTNEQFLDEVYKNYDELFDSYHPPFSAPYPKKLTKEEFLDQCKKDPKFAEEYGLKVEMHELTLEERNHSLGVQAVYQGTFGVNELSDSKYKELFDKQNRPTKLIRLTYNNQTIESYYDGRA